MCSKLLKYTPHPVQFCDFGSSPVDAYAKMLKKKKHLLKIQQKPRLINLSLS